MLPVVMTNSLTHFEIYGQVGGLLSAINTGSAEANTLNNSLRADNGAAQTLDQLNSWSSKETWRWSIQQLGGLTHRAIPGLMRTHQA